MKVVIAFLFLLAGSAQANRLESIETICRTFEGKVLGWRNNAPVRAECSNLRIVFLDMTESLREPIFRDLRNALKRARHQNFEEALVKDKIFGNDCVPQRSDRRIYSCGFAPGTSSRAFFHLSSSGRLESSRIIVDAEMFRPAIINTMSRAGMSDLTADLSSVYLHLFVLRMRQLSLPDELYSTDGRSLIVEIRPWATP